MRLEDRDQPARLPGTGHREGDGELRRDVRVVVEEQGATRATALLEAAADAGEGRERMRRIRRGHTHQLADGHRGGRVEEVVRAVDPQGERHLRPVDVEGSAGPSRARRW